MEVTTTKTEVMMKPIFLKAGVGLLLSVAGVVCSRIMASRIMANRGIFGKAPLESKESSMENMDSHEEFSDKGSRGSLGLASSVVKDEEDQIIITGSHLMGSIESLDTHREALVREEILGLKSRIEGLQKIHRDLARELLCYHDMREQESALTELKNRLLLEAARVEFLHRETSSVAAEKEKFESLVMEYVKIQQQLQSAKTENGLLKRKEKKYLRKTKVQLRVIEEKNLKINAAEREILRLGDTLQTRTNVIKKLEDEVGELQTVVSRLEEEKTEILTKLNSVEDSVSSIARMEEAGVTMEAYPQLVNELDQLRKDRAAEISELIFLRWTNACLKHELMRGHEQQHEHRIEKQHYLELEFQPSCKEVQDHSLKNQDCGSVFGCSGPEPPLMANGTKDFSRRRKFLQKIKKWVEGPENTKPKLDDRERHETKCFGRLSVSEEAEEDHLIHAARKSYSSA